jgi:hypothetical protein
MQTQQTPVARLFADWLTQDAAQAQRFTRDGETRLLDLEAQIAAAPPVSVADLYRKIAVADAGGDMNMTSQQIALAAEARATLGLSPLDSPARAA